jgi:hypothetical protein
VKGDVGKPKAKTNEAVEYIPKLEPVSVREMDERAGPKIDMDEPSQIILPIPAKERASQKVTEEPYISFEETDAPKARTK